MAEKNIKEEKKTVSQNVADFLVKFRLPLLCVVGACIVAAVVVGVVLAVTQSSHKKALSELDSIMYPLSQKSESDLTAAQDEALPKLDSLAQKNKGNIGGVRAYMAIAEIYFSRDQYEPAAEAWVKAAVAEEDSYTAAVCYYNAAVCYEEMGDVATAVSYYEKALANKECLFVPHVLFSLGRLAEESGDFEKAANRYNELVGSYPSDEWANLAKSRLIELGIEGKIQ